MGIELLLNPFAKSLATLFSKKNPVVSGDGEEFLSDDTPSDADDIPAGEDDTDDLYGPADDEGEDFMDTSGKREYEE